MNINTDATTATHDTDINAGTLSDSELDFSVCCTIIGPGITNDVHEKHIIITFNAIIPDVMAPVVLIPPVHSTSLGSGSHSPFPIHVDELDSFRICPGGQANVIFCPSSAGSMKSRALVSFIGSLHLPVEYNKFKFIYHDMHHYFRAYYSSAQ